ncbi:hypothetical protein, partial [Lentzea flava]|uniref:hypothetical protein n=1 Tax=Lentzea flava TaxID=103732 RepID=UPI001670EBF9
MISLEHQASPGYFKFKSALTGELVGEWAWGMLRSEDPRTGHLYTDAGVAKVSGGLLNEWSVPLVLREVVSLSAVVLPE